MVRWHRAGLVVVLSLCTATGCGLVLGIDEGRLVAGGGADGDLADTSADTSVTNPLGDGGNGGDGGDGGILADAGCTPVTSSVTGIADTFIYPTQDAGDPFGKQTSINIGFDGAYGLFRFDLKDLAAKLTAKGTKVTLVLTPYPSQVNQQVGGTVQVYPVVNDWDEGTAAGGATWWNKSPGVAWKEAGAGGAERGSLVSNVTITFGAMPDGGPHAFPIGDLMHTADWLAGVSTTELSLLVVPDIATPALRLWITGHELSAPQYGPPMLVVSTCAP